MTSLAILSALFLAGVPALPDIRVELVPTTPPPYSGGESFIVDVWLHSEMTVDVRLRVVRFDFELTSTELNIPSELSFDFSSLSSAGQEAYVTEPLMPLPQTENSLLCFCPDWYLLLSSGGSLHIGSLPIQVPTEGGTYWLDAINTPATEWERGAMIFVDYSSVDGIRRADTGEIVGGQFDFVVSPPAIPATSDWGTLVAFLSVAIASTLIIRTKDAPNIGRVFNSCLENSQGRVRF